jgi:NAD(P)-dependent dehydrogenase (short-subunit alcohol dehydrogenase family)
MVDRVAGELGGLSILVHNAGIASRGKPVADTDLDEPGRLMANHVFGPFALTQRAMPHLRTAGTDGGRADVVFISSVATRHFNAFGAPYTMAKAAMEALAFTLSKEERRNGVHVNVVAPGLVRTEMGRRLVKAWGADIDTLDPSSPFGRVCTPDDVANVVRWIVSEGAGYLTGERIYVDGVGIGTS